MFEANKWEQRCKTCKFAIYSKKLQIISCSKHRGDECQYIENETGLLKVDYTDKKEPKDKTGKRCPTCGIWFPFSQLVPKTVKGKIYYTYCRECRRKQHKKVNK